MLTIPQRRPAEAEGTSLAPLGIMPTTTKTPSKTTAPNDAPPPPPQAAHPSRSETRPVEARESTDDLYDNVACTD